MIDESEKGEECKKVEDMFNRFDTILERDRWTAHHSIGCIMHSIARQN